MDNELHLFCLHYVYQPKINACLNMFSQAWNCHPMQSENGLSPEQLWFRGMAWYQGHSTQMSLVSYHGVIIMQMHNYRNTIPSTNKRHRLHCMEWTGILPCVPMTMPKQWRFLSLLFLSLHQTIPISNKLLTLLPTLLTMELTNT